MRIASFCLALLAAGCSAAVSGNGRATAGHGAAPALPEERLVLAYILDNANDPPSVEIAKWGPHGLDDKLAVKFVRAKYRANNRNGAKELMEEQFVIEEGKVVHHYSVRP